MKSFMKNYLFVIEILDQIDSYSTGIISGLNSNFQLKNFKSHFDSVNSTIHKRYISSQDLICLDS